jgi:hypothetical protein
MLANEMLEPVTLKGYDIVAVLPNLFVTVTEMGALLANLFPGTAYESTPDATDADVKIDELNVGPEYVNGAPYVSDTNEASEMEPL